MLMGVVFVPVYLQFLGIEAYGLIGFFLTLQSVFGIMDLGLSLTLNRELARGSSQEGGGPHMASLLRTMEIVYWLVSVLVGLFVLLCAPWIAGSWVNTVALSSETVQSAVRMMGIIIAVQAPFALYQGGLTGLQRQVSVNLILTLAATMRAAGAALVLWLLSPTVQAYFAWQVLVAGAATALCAYALWQRIPGGARRAHFDPELLLGIRRFAFAVSANVIVGISLTQLDKLILVKLLTLEEFGYYMLAVLVASLLWGIILPINTALFPQFAQLHELRDEAGLTTLYHTACQLMSVALLPVALLLGLFSYELLNMWTSDEATARKAYLLVSLITVGTTLNGLTSVAAYLQSAAGWPGLILRTNFILALLLVPMLWVVVPRFGPIGAAAVWIIINAAYLVSTVPIMHRRLLCGELGRWYLADLLLPLIAVASVGLPARLLMPVGLSTFGQLVFLGCVWATAVASAMVVTPAMKPVLSSLALRVRARIADMHRVGIPE